MAIVPIPIFIRERTDEELRADSERRREIWREEEAEARRERKRIEAKKRKKMEAKMAREKELEEAYDKLKRENPWETKILPEGWTIWGQTTFPIINYDGPIKKNI